MKIEIFCRLEKMLIKEPRKRLAKSFVDCKDKYVHHAKPSTVLLLFNIICIPHSTHIN